MCTAVKVDNAANTHYEYMYIYKYPEKTVPEGGESAYVETLSIDCNGYTLDVSVIGLNEGSKYFDASPEKGKNKAVINNSLAERYGLKSGDKLTRLRSRYGLHIYRFGYCEVFSGVYFIYGY